MSLADVSDVLWSERELICTLATAPEPKEHADELLARLRLAEILRAVEVQVAAVELGLGQTPTLQTLARYAPDPWGDLLTQHREALLREGQGGPRLPPTLVDFLQ